MLQYIERRNRQIWDGHPQTLEDAAHVAGGVGFGFLLYGRVREHARPLAFILIAVALGLHAYAAMVKPAGYRPGRFAPSGYARG